MYACLRLLSVALLLSYLPSLTAQMPVARPRKPPTVSGSLAGMVTEAPTRAPLAKATVTIPDLQLSAVADAAGHYVFRSLPAGRYLVVVSYVGFKTFSRPVDVNGATIADFALTGEAVEGNAVVVTGASHATQVRLNPVPVTAVPHDYLMRTAGTNIIDAISKVPGVSALTTGPNVSKPFIRGLGYNRILTLFDGVRQEGQQWGDEHGIEVDQYDVDRVEVIKGPASLGFGSDALAGVVNLIPTPAAPEGKVKGELLTEYQTNNGLAGESAMIGATGRSYEWMGRVSHKSATNYRNRYDGRVYNTAFSETDASVVGGIHRPWGFSHLRLSAYNDLQEIPDGSRDSATRKFTRQITEADTIRPIVSDADLHSYKIGPLHQLVQHLRAYSTNSIRVGEGRLLVNLAFQRSVRREFNHPEPDAWHVAGLFLQLNTFSYDLKYALPERNGWNLSAGVNGMWQTNKVDRGTEFIIPAYHQFDAGPFLLLRKNVKRLEIAGGVRYDGRWFRNDALSAVDDPATGFSRVASPKDTGAVRNLFTAYRRTFSGFSGSIGATFSFSESVAVKANVSRGYRAPNVSEIASNGPHPGTNIYQLGNTGFVPEFSLQEDVGITYHSSHFALTLGLFNNDLSHYIFNQRVLTAAGEDSVIVPGNQTFQFRQGKAHLYGGEISIDVHPVAALHFENSLSVVYARNTDRAGSVITDSNRYLPFIPPLHGLSEIRLSVTSRRFHLSDGFVKAEVAYYAKQSRVYLADDTETPTPGYALFNAGFGGRWLNKKGRTLLQFSLMGNNLLDIAYQDHLSRLKYFEPFSYSPTGHYGIYNMGRNVALRITFPLGFSAE